MDDRVWFFSVPAFQGPTSFFSPIILSLGYHNYISLYVI